jgi:hypothetical protein
MNHSYYSITLDVKAIQSQVTLPVKQGDTTRGVYISFVDGGEAYIIEGDCFAVFKGEKSDGSELGNYCTIEDNKIIYPFTPETVSSPGVIACEVSLYNTKEELITSARFSIFVDSRLVGSENYKSSSEYTSLEEFLIKVELAEEERVRAEEARKNTFVIDTELDEDSENPVSNKVITEMFNLITEAVGELDDRYERVLYKSHDIFDDTSGYPSYPTTKAVYDYGQKILETIQGDLDEIGDLVGGEDGETGGLIADIGNIELVYDEEESCYKGTFTLPENSIESGKLYIINIDGTEYKSGSLGAEGEFYISNDAREDSMIMISKQEDVWTVAIYSANDFSGVHNIKIYKNPNEKKPYQILVGSRTDTGTGGDGMVHFYTDDFDAGSYNLEIKDEEGTFNFDSYRYLDNTAFGFKSCDKDYSDASLKQVYLAIADGKKVSFIVTGKKDGIETTKTYVLGTPDFEWTNSYTPRHYYCYGENFIPYADYPS